MDNCLWWIVTFILANAHFLCQLVSLTLTWMSQLLHSPLLSEVFFIMINVFLDHVFVLIYLYRAENMARKAAGEEPLPEEDPSNPVFKPIPEPSRLDSFLITNQVSNYCNQINGYVGLIEADWRVMTC